MMTVLIAAPGSAGDVLPFAFIGAELRRRGHDVTLLANPHFSEVAHRLDLTLRAIGSEQGFAALRDDPDLAHPGASASEALDRHFGHFVEAANHAIRELNRPSSTVVFGPANTSAAWIAAEECDIPFVGGLVAPMWLPSVFDPPYPADPLPRRLAWLARSHAGARLLTAGAVLALRFCKLTGRTRPGTDLGPFLNRINRLRRERGVRQVRAMDDGATAKHLICMWPDWFYKKQRDWPAQAVATGFPFDPGERAFLGDERDAHPGCDTSKPIVFTTGTVASRQGEFFATAVEACQRLGRSGLLLTPRSEDVPAALPDTIRHLRHAPFGELFPKAALVVHHGGVGTTAIALAAGVPQIARPIRGEQFDLAYRMERLGVGRMMKAPVSAARLAQAADALLSSPQVRTSCRTWRARNDLAAGAQRGADVIERAMVR